MIPVEADLLATLGRLVEVLEATSTSYALIGGIAKAAWGRARATRDIDIAISVDASGLTTLQSTLAAYGFETTTMVGSTDADGRPDIFVAKGPFGVPVDVLVAKTPFEEDAVARSVPIELLGQRVHVVTAEDLVFYKLLAGRPRDRDDVLDVIRAQIAGGRPFDWARLTRLSGEWEIEDTLAAVRKEAGVD